MDSKAIDEFCKDLIEDTIALAATEKQLIEAQCTGMDESRCRKCVTYQCENYGQQLVPLDELNKKEWCALMRYPVEFRALHDIEQVIIEEKEGIIKGE